jgi:uracil-DNA glycosylase family 4
VTRCPNCPNIHTPLPCDGPKDASVLLIGEAPGKQEQKKGVVFVGKTGQELDKQYLPLGGLYRSGVMITNAISCLPPGPDGKLDPKSARDTELLESCSQCHLHPLLDSRRWRVIVPMGNFACRAVDPSIRLEFDHGIPRRTSYGVVFPMYHPAGGIHTPKSMLQIRTDWIRLKQYLTGKLYMPKDEYAGREEYGIVESTGQLSSILSEAVNDPMAVDTETRRDGSPFCLTFSVREGQGWLIPADARAMLTHYQGYLCKWAGHIVFHNWLFDRAVTRRMGLIIPDRKVKDTMMMAFQLGNVPQGLKALSYRELGMHMSDFDDMVTPHSTPVVLRYYRACYDEEWPKPEQIMYRTPEGKWKVKKPHGMKTKLKTFYTYLTKNPDKDVFAAWDNWEDSHEMIQERMGPWPGKCITHAWEADRDSVVHYACQDADATLRLYPVLREMIQRMRRAPQELWRRREE